MRSQNLFGLGGKMTTAFEQGFAKLYGAKYCVGSTSGTAAIHVAIGTVDPDPGDEIISAPITDGGGIVPVLYQNAIPVFADIDATFNMDPRDVERQDHAAHQGHRRRAPGRQPGRHGRHGGRGQAPQRLPHRGLLASPT